MIVKNESHVIKETLENLCKYINFSYYVISDTGSTDNTIQIIKDFFNERNIRGEIYNDNWKDFGYNRSLALKYAHKKTDYLFIFDADDKIFGNFKFPSVMDKDSYFLKFGNGVTYKRILLINNQLEWNFIGVLHEYINCISKKHTSCDLIDGEYFVDSGKSGSRSNDPQKYSKDAIILEKAFYEAEKNNEHIKIRYAFYTAQSYRDSDQKEKAIEWYKKRVSLKDWDQEVYFSYYMIGKLYRELNDIEKAIYYWTLAYEVDGDRYESIYEIISHFRITGHPTIAYQYYLMIKNFNPDLYNKLFVYFPIYEYLLDYELSIILSYNNKHPDAIKIYQKLFSIPNIQFELKITILDNFIFYINSIQRNLKFNENYLDFVRNIFLQTNMFLENHVDVINKITTKFISYYPFYDVQLIKDKLFNKKEKVTVFLSMTSCKRYDLFLRTVNSFLICCKDIHLIDYFFCVDDNSSKEDRKNMITNFSFFKYYLKKEDEKGHLNSMNIIWDKLNELKPKYWIHLEDDWEFIKPCNYIEKSINFLEKYKKDNIHQILFNRNYGETIDCYNLTGGERIDNEFLLHIKDQPNLTGRNCSYWPHYSFRPSVVNTDIILNIGNFNSPNTFFEMDYANKYHNLGYKSAFFNEITCLHIGRLTSEKHLNNKKNAYQLNGVGQFSEIKDENNYKFAIIGSNDLGDQNINIVNRVNSENFVLNQYIKKLFINNKFNSSKRTICNYLSHINAWKKLDYDNVNYYLISDFKILIDEKLKNFIKKIVDTNQIELLIFKNKINLIVTNKEIETRSKLIIDSTPISLSKIKLENINTESYIYLINKNSVKKLMNFIGNNGIIDKNIKELFIKNDNIVGLETDEYIFNTNINYETDEYMFNTNINYETEDNSEIIDLNEINNNSDYLFIKTKDHYGDDIEYKNNLSLEEMIFNSDLNENCIGFNTLGFFKHKVDIDTLIDLNTGNHDDGIYINIKRYNKKYNKNIYNENNSIENNIESIVLSEDSLSKNNFNKEIDTLDYLFIKTKDHHGDDIDYKNNLSLEQMMLHSILNDNCICFNTLGFFKNNVNMDNLIDLNTDNPNDGIYINIKKYNEKYNKNIYNENNSIKDNNILSENNINIENFDEVKVSDNINLLLMSENNIDNENIYPIELSENNINIEQVKVSENNVSIEDINSAQISENNIETLLNTEDNNYIYNKNKFMILKNKILEGSEIKLENDNIKNLLDFVNNNVNYMSVSNNGSFKNNIYIGSFVNTENTNSFVHYEKYIKYHYTDFSIKTEYIKFIEDYLVIEKSDFVGNDVDYRSGLQIYELMELANKMDNCDSFNSIGLFKNYININGMTNNNYIIHNNLKIFIKINKLYGKNKFLILKNQNTLNVDYKYNNEFNDDAIANFMEDKDHIAYNSYGYLIKYSDNMFKNLLKINEVHNNYVAIDVVKLYNIQKKNKKETRVKIIDNLFNNDLNKFSMGSLKWNKYEFVFTDSFVDYYVILGDENNKSYYNPNKTIILNSNKINNDVYKNIKSNIAFWKNNKNYVELKYSKCSKKHDKIICDLYTNNNFLDYINSRKSDFADNINDNYQSIFDYKYAIINDKNNIWDALLAETFCFYTGDDDISGYINNDVFIKININNEEDSYNTIIKLIEENIWEKNIDLIKKEKENILDYYNLFPTIERIIENR